MDVIEASHFEVIKQFINKTHYIFKLRHNKRTSMWVIELIANHEYKHFNQYRWGKPLS